MRRPRCARGAWRSATGGCPDVPMLAKEWFPSTKWRLGGIRERYAHDFPPPLTTSFLHAVPL